MGGSSCRVAVLGLALLAPAAGFAPTAARRRAPVAHALHRQPPPPLVMLAKKKKGKKKMGGGPPPPQSPPQPPPPQSPQPQSLPQPPPPPATAPAADAGMQRMQVTVPQGMYPGDPLQVQTPSGLMQVTIPAGCGPGAAFEMMVPTQPQQVASPPPPPPPPPPPSAPPPPPAEMPLPLMSTPFSADGPLDKAPREQEEATADFGGVEDALPALEPLQLQLDDAKVPLPSFEEYSRGPPKPVPKSTTYSSKLPSINQGRYRAAPFVRMDLFGPCVTAVPAASDRPRVRACLRA